jgi:hypothetical protein
MTVRSIYCPELIELAYELAESGEKRDSLRTVLLRRSISTSYYALFHYLGYSAAELLIGDDPSRETQRNLMARWIGHRDVLDLARGAFRPGGAIAGVLPRTCPDLRRIAEAFESLQALRERADYDYQFDVSRAVALEAANTAADVTARANNLWDQQEESYLLFLRLMVGAVRIAKNR